MPRTWSPSTIVPVASTAIRRSASPSRAKPTSAPRSRDGLGQRCRRGGAGPDVDVDPVGLVVDDLDGRAGRAEDLRPDDAARPVRAVEDDPQAARRRSGRRARAGARGSGRGGPGRRPTDRCSALPTEPSSSVRQISCSISSSMPSSSLRPLPSRTFSPLSSAGLCDAETMIPAAKSPVPARNARAGVGTQPAIRTSAPRLVAPAAIAETNMSPGAARVLPDDELAALADEPMGGGAPERVGEGRLELDVGDAADPVGPEEAGHRQPPADGAGAGRRRDVIVTVTVAGSTLSWRSPAWRFRVGRSSWVPTPRPVTSRLTVSADGVKAVEVGLRPADRDEHAAGRELVVEAGLAPDEERAGREGRRAGLGFDA